VPISLSRANSSIEAIVKAPRMCELATVQRNKSICTHSPVLVFTGFFAPRSKKIEAHVFLSP
jgi:hypothetical protein